MEIHITEDGENKVTLKNVTLQEAIADYLFAETLKLNIRRTKASSWTTVGDINTIYLKCLEDAKDYI